MLTVLPLFLGKIGAPELILIVVIVVVLFGGRKIPELMKGVGRGIKEFKDAMSKDYSDPKEEKTEAPKAETKVETTKAEEVK